MPERELPAATDDLLEEPLPLGTSHLEAAELASEFRRRAPIGSTTADHDVRTEMLDVTFDERLGRTWKPVQDYGYAQGAILAARPRASFSLAVAKARATGRSLREPHVCTHKA